jgi:hypothetical protein
LQAQIRAMHAKPKRWEHWQPSLPCDAPNAPQVPANGGFAEGDAMAVVST